MFVSGQNFDYFRPRPGRGRPRADEQLFELIDKTHCISLPTLGWKVHRFYVMLTTRGGAGEEGKGVKTEKIPDTAGRPLVMALEQ